MSDVTLGQLSKGLRDAGGTVNVAIAPVVKRTSNKAKATQRRRVQRRSGKTADSITVRNDEGEPLGPKDVNATIGPTWYVGNMLERGTVNMPPFPFVEFSLEEHMPSHVDDCGKAVVKHIEKAIG